MRRVLVTAGATRNPVDAIRYLSAASSGATGVALACALAPGVDLLGSDEALLRLRIAHLECPDGRIGSIPAHAFGSTRDLLAKVRQWVLDNPHGIVVHAAAVGDYEAPSEGRKLPSGQPALSLHLSPAPKILDQIRGWSASVGIVSFKAAPPASTVEDLARIGDAQRQRTDSTLVFANTIGRLASDVVILGPSGAAVHRTRQDAMNALVQSIQEMSDQAP